MKQNQIWMERRIDALQIISWIALIGSGVVCLVILIGGLTVIQPLMSRYLPAPVTVVGELILFTIVAVIGVTIWINLQNQAALLQTILNIDENTEDTTEAVKELSQAIDRLVTMLARNPNDRQIGGP
jgi:heme A synthase